jgi:hypothetical protein
MGGRYPQQVKDRPMKMMQGYLDEYESVHQAAFGIEAWSASCRRTSGCASADVRGEDRLLSLSCSGSEKWNMRFAIWWRGTRL